MKAAFLSFVSAATAFSQSISVALPRATGAFLQKDGKEAIVVVQSLGVSRIDVVDAKPIATIPDTADLYTLAGNETTLVGLNPKGFAVIDRASLKVTRRANIDGILPNARPYLSIYGRLFLMGKNREHAGQVISLSEVPTITKRFGHGIEGTLYATPGFSERADRLYIPGAHPGEIVFIALSDPREEQPKRIQVKDWLHDVKLIDDNKAIIAGHLEGVSVLDLNAPDKTELLSKTKFAHLLIEGDHIIATSNGLVEKINLKTRYIQTAKFETISGGMSDNLIPLGRNAKGELVIHEEGAGLIVIQDKI